jgi:hypothetical protein
VTTLSGAPDADRIVDQSGLEIIEKEHSVEQECIDAKLGRD